MILNRRSHLEIISKFFKKVNYRITLLKSFHYKVSHSPSSQKFYLKAQNIYMEVFEISSISTLSIAKQTWALCKKTSCTQPHFIFCFVELNTTSSILTYIQHSPGLSEPATSINWNEIISKPKKKKNYSYLLKVF